MDKLKRLPGDATYHNLNVVDWLSKGKGKYYSFDLSSATDRFPMVIQRECVAAYFGEVVADSWQDLITGYEFITPTGQSVRYRTGQPIGAYSS